MWSFGYEGREELRNQMRSQGDTDCQNRQLFPSAVVWMLATSPLMVNSSLPVQPCWVVGTVERCLGIRERGIMWRSQDRVSDGGEFPLLLTHILSQTLTHAPPLFSLSHVHHVMSSAGLWWPWSDVIDRSWTLQPSGLWKVTASLYKLHSVWYYVLTTTTKKTWTKTLLSETEADIKNCGVHRVTPEWPEDCPRQRKEDMNLWYFHLSPPVPSSPSISETHRCGGQSTLGIRCSGK